MRSAAPSRPSRRHRRPAHRARWVAGLVVAVLAGGTVLLVWQPWRAQEVATAEPDAATVPDASTEPGGTTGPATGSAPSFCDALADAADIRALETVMPAIVSGQSTDADRRTAQRAATGLRQLAQRPDVEESVAGSLSAAADAVESLSGGRPPTSEDQLAGLTSAFTDLDQEVQDTCAFPLE